MRPLLSRSLPLIAWFLGFSVLFGMWSLATPLWSTPDAQHHELAAWAFGHGDLNPEQTEQETNGVNTNAIVMVPKGIVDSAETTGCFAHHPDRPASCVKPILPDSSRTAFVSSAARNFPVYYAVVGAATNFGSNAQGIFLMRVVAIALVAWLLAWAATACLHTRRPGLALSGLFISITPMFAYLGGVMNPNSFEIAAAYATAVCTLVYFADPTSPTGEKMLRRAAIAATILGSTRILGPVWLAIWVVALLILQRKDLFTLPLKARNRWWLLAPVAGVVANMAWMKRSGVDNIRTEPLHDLGFLDRLHATYDHIMNTLPQIVGNFGWLDTPLPMHLIIVYVIMTGFLLGVGWLALSRREFWATTAAVAMALAAPILLETWKYNLQGAVWQGRYMLPTIGLVPILVLTSAALSKREDPLWERTAVRWTFAGGLTVLAWVHFAALQLQLKRNMHGLKLPRIKDRHWPTWHPPVEPWLISSVLALTMLV
ncbi:MAG TPA: DUF2142 domain-containing protein, partial [Marmoricola sp.]|nr:DUF2142 domain-containing protein [Marmoricola sp.]